MLCFRVLNSNLYFCDKSPKIAANQLQVKIFVEKKILRMQEIVIFLLIKLIIGNIKDKSAECGLQRKSF